MSSSSREGKIQAGLEENNSQQQFYQRQLMGKLKQWVDRDEIFAIKGPRQSGKTTLLKIFKNWLIEEKSVKKDHIVFMTFEDLDNREDFENSPKEFIKSYIVDEDRHYFLLDEFHYIEEGGKKLKLLYDTLENVKFLITGSSSLELKSETSKHLVGRLFSFHLYPFSFWEFLNAKSKRLRKIYEKKNQEVMEFIEEGKSFESEELISKNKLEKELSSYLRFGSYPEVIKARERETKEMIIKNLFNTYITRDIIELLEIHESSKIKKLVTALSSQLGGMTNYNDLSSTCETYYKKIKRFMNILEETYVLEVIRPYHKNVKTELKKNPKVYFVDPGLRNYAIDNFSELEKREDRGELVENFVLNQLKRKELGELHYWRTQGKAEVDFILSKGENLIPIEVKYREMRDLKIHSGLKSFISSYNPERALVVTKNLQGSLDYKGTDVKFVPAVCI